MSSVNSSTVGVQHSRRSFSDDPANKGSFGAESQNIRSGAPVHGGVDRCLDAESAFGRHVSPRKVPTERTALPGTAARPKPVASGHASRIGPDQAVSAQTALAKVDRSPPSER
jgi:hypothetical protein